MVMRLVVLLLVVAGRVLVVWRRVVAREGQAVALVRAVMVHVAQVVAVETPAAREVEWVCVCVCVCVCLYSDNHMRVPAGMRETSTHMPYEMQATP